MIKTQEPDTTGNNRDSIGRFAKGKSGNPEGRPVGSISLLSDLKKKLLEIKDKDPKEYDKLINHYWKSERTRQFLMEMIDGKPKQSIDASHTFHELQDILDQIKKDEQ